ncbi:Cell division protein ZapA-like protein, partial [mine drainage metagenome]
NARMREVRDSGKVVGLDRVAVMVALNMANELLQLRTRGSRVTVEASDKVRALRERLESALGHTQPLEL